MDCSFVWELGWPLIKYIEPYRQTYPEHVLVGSGQNTKSI